MPLSSSIITLPENSTISPSLHLVELAGTPHLRHAIVRNAAPTGVVGVRACINHHSSSCRNPWLHPLLARAVGTSPAFANTKVVAPSSSQQRSWYHHARTQSRHTRSFNGSTTVTCRHEPLAQPPFPLENVHMTPLPRDNRRPNNTFRVNFATTTTTTIISPEPLTAAKP